jgi:hypothetical protein
LRPPDFIAIRLIKVGSGCKSGKFNVNVYVLLVTGLYMQVTVVVQTSQPVCIY